jgi:hypothetical protein
MRTRLGLMPERVSDYLSTYSGAISRYERGLREPSLLEMLAFSRMSAVGVRILIEDKTSLTKKSYRLRIAAVP